MTIGIKPDAGGTFATIDIGGVDILKISGDGTVEALTGPIKAAGVSTQRMMLVAAKATTSGTAIDFSPADGTGIPSWATRITLNLYKVSTNGTSIPQIQIGTSGGVVTSGYEGAVDSQNTGGGITASITSGIALIRSGGAGAAQSISGRVVFERHSGNTWIGTFTGGAVGSLTLVSWAWTNIALAGALDRIRLTTVNGTDTFDAGSVSLIIEG